MPPPRAPRPRRPPARRRRAPAGVVPGTSVAGVVRGASGAGVVRGASGARVVRGRPGTPGGCVRPAFRAARRRVARAGRARLYKALPIAGGAVVDVEARPRPPPARLPRNGRRGPPWKGRGLAGRAPAASAETALLRPREPPEPRAGPSPERPPRLAPPAPPPSRPRSRRSVTGPAGKGGGAGPACQALGADFFLFPFRDPRDLPGLGAARPTRPARGWQLPGVRRRGCECRGGGRGPGRAPPRPGRRPGRPAPGPLRALRPLRAPRPCPRVPAPRPPAHSGHASAAPRPGTRPDRPRGSPRRSRKRGENSEEKVSWERAPWEAGRHGCASGASGVDLGKPPALKTDSAARY